MQSLFEPKLSATVDPTIFNVMKETAIHLLSEVEKGRYTQAIVLRSSNQNTYSIIICDALSMDYRDETSLLKNIQEAKDSQINFVLCMWQDHCIDIPSFAFRKMLLQSNTENSETTLFVMTTEGVSGIKLSATMK